MTLRTPTPCKQKLPLAQRLGANRTVNPNERDTVVSVIRSLRKGGTLVLVGNLSPTVDLPLQEVVSRET
jgi:Zn-dependent alcohol dehydrogenase